MRTPLCRSPVFITLLALTIAESRVEPLAGASFQGLGQPNTRPWNISADGRTVVGDFNPNTPDEGWVSSRNTGDFRTIEGTRLVADVSATGLVAVGVLNVPAAGKPFRWIRVGDQLQRFDFPGWATAVSDNGLVVAGFQHFSSTYRSAFVTSASGMKDLGDLPGGDHNSTANGISGDGRVVVGTATNAFGKEAFRWTEDGGMIGLGDLSGLFLGSVAAATSINGRNVVGAAKNLDGEYEAFQWTEEFGMIGLDEQGLGVSSQANGVSSDGRVIVGGVVPPGVNQEITAFVWTATHGMQNLTELLRQESGVDVEDWTLLAATGVSGDGTSIVGEGINPQGIREGWLVHLPSLGTIRGDTNGDNEVDLEDLNNVRNNFGGTGLGDANYDGLVDLEDLNAVRNNFGMSNPVPEPPPLVLLAAGAAGLSALCRRRNVSN